MSTKTILILVAIGGVLYYFYKKRQMENNAATIAQAQIAALGAFH